MTLLVLLFLELYTAKQKEYKQNIYKSMQVCSYTMDCPQFDFDFADYNQSKLGELYQNNGLNAYFTIPASEQYMIQFHYLQEKLVDDMKNIRYNLWTKFILASLVLLFLSLFFTLYSLKPIRKALRLNDEFIKDILHDFNTPISAMILNIKMFKEDYKENYFVQNISHSIDNISLLQENLKSFLYHSPTQTSTINMDELIQNRVTFVQNIYPNIYFDICIEDTFTCRTYEELLIRVIDNLLTNAAKYNKPKGKVTLTLQRYKLTIEDTGKGIKNIDKVFERYYKEQDRGLGLGLPIVKKLTDTLDISLSMHSVLKVGTTVILDFSHLSRE